MAAIAWTDVTDVASQLSAVGPAAQTAILLFVNTTLNVQLLGGEDSPRLKLARTFLAAHIGELVRRRDQQAGPVASKSVSASSLSVSYASMANGDALSSTSYGGLYKLMLLGSGARIGFPT